MTDTPLWVAEAIKHVGTSEIAGKANNPAIMQFYKDCGHNGIAFETTAWCAAFVGACLKRAGKPVSQPVELNLMARSYLKYGTKLAKPVPGCIAIWPRGKPPSGHVGFVVSVDEKKGTIRTIEGNVSNRVKYATHKISDALGYRWPPENGTGKGKLVIPTADKPKDDYPKTTVKEVVATSRKAKALSRFKNAMHSIWVSLGIGSFLEWLGFAKGTMDQVAQFVSQHALVLAITGAILAVLTVKYVLSLMAEDVDAGRYTPSGEKAA